MAYARQREPHAPERCRAIRPAPLALTIASLGKTALSRGLATQLK